MQKLNFIITPPDHRPLPFHDEYKAFCWAKDHNPQLLTQIELSCRDRGTILRKFCTALGYKYDVQPVDTSCKTTILPAESLWIQENGIAGE